MGGIADRLRPRSSGPCQRRIQSGNRRGPGRSRSGLPLRSCTRGSAPAARRQGAGRVHTYFCPSAASGTDLTGTLGHRQGPCSGALERGRLSPWSRDFARPPFSLGLVALRRGSTELRFLLALCRIARARRRIRRRAANAAPRHGGRTSHESTVASTGQPGGAGEGCAGSPRFVPDSPLTAVGPSG